jgi:chromosome segregation ATPase
MKACLLFFLLSSFSGLSFADEASDAELRKLRESLRTLTTQVRTAETERDAAKAAQTGLERKTKELTAKVEFLTKQAAADQAAGEKKITSLEEKTATQEKEIALLAANIEKWKAAFQQVSEFARTKEAERAALGRRNIEADRLIAAQQKKNVTLLAIATDILKEYEGFSLGKAIANREPFVRTARVKMENLVQDYTDKLYAQRLKPGQTVTAPPPPAKSEPKPKP